eukprot:497906-Rhodomonas_salina.1
MVLWYGPTEQGSEAVRFSCDATARNQLQGPSLPVHFVPGVPSRLFFPAVHTVCADPRGSGDLLNCEIKYQKPHSWYKLYSKSGLLCLISGCSRRQVMPDTPYYSVVLVCLTHRTTRWYKYAVA